MDEILILIFVLLIAIILSAIILPIIALVISIRSRRKLTEKLSTIQATQTASVPGALPASGDVATAIQHLNTRIEKLEAAVASHSIPVSAVVPEPTKPEVEETVERPISERDTELQRDI